MNAPAFTPGHWELRGPRQIYGNLQRDQNSTADLVAISIRVDDAHLIAAAPMLYDALRLWLADFDDDRRDEQLEYDHAARFRIALAHARGESR